MWVTAYTEGVIRAVADMLFDVYDTFLLWWLPHDVFRFAWKLGDIMEPYLGSLPNVREYIERTGIIEETKFELVGLS